MTANPTLLSMPLAQNGQKNVIPATQVTAGDGLFSQSTGFPAETSLPLGAGGVAPSREDFNGLANLLGGVAFYAQKGWQFQFDAGQDYFAGCVVRDTTDGALYECINDVSAGGSVPSADSTNWQPFGSDLGYLLRKNNTAYAVGDIAFSASLPSYLVLECSVAGTTATTEPDFSGATEGDTVTDGSVEWTYKKLLSGGVLPQIMVTAPTGCTVTATNDGTTLTAIESSGTYELNVPNFGDWTVTCTKNVGGVQRSAQKVVSVTAVQVYPISMSYGYQYGFRIRKDESSPDGAVEYILDAVGMTPAHMDFTNGVFDYGDWANAWFVTDNKPLMLKNDGTVDYYLDPNDYDKKVDGTSSDVANTSYDGNAMAQIPLVWVKRYEDSDYWYEIISDVQIDDTYKAYAHTRADGSIADYFYYAMFRGSGTSSGIRSLSGQTLSSGLTPANGVAGATANGSLWYTSTWSQYQLIRTLLMLMGRCRNALSVFGNGNARGATGTTQATLQTGTLKTMGQFFGYSANNKQVKVFHIEAPWGDQWNYMAGITVSSYKVYAKMTREGNGYSVANVSDYNDTGVTIPSGSANYIKSVNCSDYGMIPNVGGGSVTTYFCSNTFATTGTQSVYIGAGANSTAGTTGGWLAMTYDPSTQFQGWTQGYALSCEMPAQA